MEEIEDNLEVLVGDVPKRKFEFKLKAGLYGFYNGKFNRTIDLVVLYDRMNLGSNKEIHGITNTTVHNG